jgi:cytoskeletal protein CcmA (bactofilin family)
VNNSSKDFSIIDTDLTVDGTLTCSGKLIIKGTVRGKLDGETVVVAKEGSVHAECQVSSMTVGGVFEGNLSATKEMVILSTGRCSGEIVCGNLTVEARGMLNAKVSCRVPKIEDRPDGKNL